MRFNNKRNFDQVRADMIRDKIDKRVKEDKEIKKTDEVLDNQEPEKRETDNEKK